MGNLEQIEKSAQKLIALCQKEKPTRTDKEKMLALHAEIFVSIENLAECELCGAISEMIVTMTLADVTAKLCKECGFKALEAGKIQATTRRTPRKQTSRTRKPKTEPEVEEIVAEEAGKIQATTRRTPRKQTSRTRKPKTEPEVEEIVAEPESPAALHTRVESQTGIKKTDVKRLHKIVQEIATPMTPEHTLTYVKREIEIAKIKVDADALEKAVELLIAA